MITGSWPTFPHRFHIVMKPGTPVALTKRDNPEFISNPDTF
jgi:hypothetical protein